MQPPADDVQPAGLLLPSHLVRIDGGCEKENSAEESETKVALVQETAMQVEGEEAVENAAPEVQTNDTAKLEGGEAGAAPDAAGEVPAGQVNEAPATADADGEETTACAAEASGRSSSLEAPASQPARIITNSVADVRTYPGLRPHGLSEDEISELFDAVQLMKSKSSNQNFVKHGWQCVYTLRSAGSATRGDMCVIDPRDGQKIFSLVGMRRKLGLEEAMELPPAYPREPMSRAEDEGEGAAAPSLVLERVRRNRTAVNYAEKAGDARSRPGEHISAVLAEADEQGLDLASMATALHKRMEHVEDTPVPYGVVRQVLIGMLRSGRARRRVRVPPAVLPGDSESALRCLVLNTMQIDPDRAAPWSLELLGDAAAGTARRMHVWKGVTPHHLPHVRGSQLVGRRVEIWWDGDLCFYPATVRHHAESNGQFGCDCGKGMFIVEYAGAGGLRAIEDLEGPYSEPQQWRLLDDHLDVDAEEEGAAAAVPAEGEGERGAAADASAAASDDAAGGPDAVGSAADATAPTEAGGAGPSDSSGGAGGGAGGAGGAGDEEHEGEAGAAVGDWLPRVEAMVSVASIRSQLPITTDDALLFHAPLGWADEPTGEEGAKPRPCWVRRDAHGEVEKRLRTRGEVEDLLEAEAADAGRAWLGQLVGGRWEIRPRCVAAALTHVANSLVDSGHISVLPPAHSGRIMVLYLARNLYFKGEPFPQNKRKREAPQPLEEEELSEFEHQRLRNIARNQELLRQLGLA